MRFARLFLLPASLLIGACAQPSGATATVEDRLRTLEDERAILHTLHTYGHAIDYNLEDEWKNSWTDDAVLHWPGRDPIVGRDAITEVFRQHPHAPKMYWKHFLVEPRIRLDGDRATADSYFARLTNQPEGPQVASFGRYRDVLVRGSDGRWRFKERMTERESSIPR